MLTYSYAIIYYAMALRLYATLCLRYAIARHDTPYIMPLPPCYATLRAIATLILLIASASWRNMPLLHLHAIADGYDITLIRYCLITPFIFVTPCRLKIYACHCLMHYAIASLIDAAADTSFAVLFMMLILRRYAFTLIHYLPPPAIRTCARYRYTRRQ